MRGLSTNALISGGLLAAFGSMLVAGYALQFLGVRSLGVFTIPVAVVFFGVLLAWFFSMIPLMLKIVLAVQVGLGNANVPLVKAAIDNQKFIVWGMWAIVGLGCAVAIPAAILDGFGNGSPFAGDALARMPVEGTLVAAPGMTLRDVARASSLKLTAGSASRLFDRSQLGGAAIFDFRVAGSGLVFRRCRYYYITTYTHHPQRIEAINVGTSSSATSRAGLQSLQAALRARLTADGWLAGYEVYRTQEDRTLHGGLTHGAQGRLWLKRGVVLDIETNRVDEPVDGENPATAGRWIQYVDLRQRADYPWIERYVFTRPGHFR
jgi:hypothetical protein